MGNNNKKIIEQMKIYNNLLERLNKATAYLTNSSTTQADKDTHMARYHQLGADMEICSKGILEMGYNIGPDEYSQGFRQIKLLEE